MNEIQSKRELGWYYHQISKTPTETGFIWSSLIFRILSQFLYGTNTGTHPPDDCGASWKCGGQLMGLLDTKRGEALIYAHRADECLKNGDPGGAFRNLESAKKIFQEARQSKDSVFYVEDYDDIEILGDLYRKTKNYRFRSNLFTCLTLTLTL
ncbi:hypothetical protein OAL96_01130 [bacterium]|nr:hypothetical protein [bacterium]